MKLISDAPWLFVYWLKNKDVGIQCVTADDYIRAKAKLTELLANQNVDHDTLTVWESPNYTAMLGIVPDALRENTKKLWRDVLGISS